VVKLAAAGISFFEVPYLDELARGLDRTLPAACGGLEDGEAGDDGNEAAAATGCNHTCAIIPADAAFNSISKHPVEAGEETPGARCLLGFAPIHSGS
jgi:hypothetical protein